ncbi:MAG TPA: carbohydrate kinase family protein [Acidimicrobiales bacterium]|nr:carbohydrate kinase family protein [Acidimicrobiales bacterium]
MAKHDVLCVGDAATDVFIRLSDAHIHTRQEGEDWWLDLPFGGKVPFDFALTVDAGGNAANAAVGLARLGVSSALVAHAGDDRIGGNMQAALEDEGVDTHLVRLDPGRPSNRNFVLWYGQDRTILVRHELYEYTWPELGPEEVPGWVYLSSVGSDAPEYYEELVSWLRSEPSVRLVFQPGTFQIALGVRTLAGVYRRTDLLVCNREEAVEIGGGDHARMDDLLECLHRLGPKTVVVTDGPAGASASDGSARYRLPAYPDPSPPKERTGAGDAFTSALLAGLVKGLPLPDALLWGPVNAMSVVRDVGSQTGLLTEPELLDHLGHAPAAYAVSVW